MTGPAPVPRRIGDPDRFDGFAVEPTALGVLLRHAPCGSRIAPARQTLRALMAAAAAHRCPGGRA